VVVSTSVIQIVADRRTTLLQDVEAMLLAEQASATARMVLVELAREMGKDELAARFALAERVEAEHLAKLRAQDSWGQGLAAPSRASE
jgi:rubrerythrin